jgi:DNA-binding MarR family transcriptional regulator
MHQQLLIEFINTLDLSLKAVEQQASSRAGVGRLTIAQLQYINAIHQLGEPTITEIAARLNITKASVTAGVNKLVSLGYAVKTPSGMDRRALQVSLTAAGREMVAARGQALAEYGAFIDAALSDEEAGQLEAILAKLVIRFKQA